MPNSVAVLCRTLVLRLVVIVVLLVITVVGRRRRWVIVVMIIRLWSRLGGGLYRLDDGGVAAGEEKHGCGEQKGCERCGASHRSISSCTAGVVVVCGVRCTSWDVSRRSDFLRTF
jgi:hypothetical protein